MLPYERKQFIINHINEKSQTSIDDICNLMDYVSSSTIRRDLKNLELEGYISIYYGGIIKRNTYLSEQKIENKRKENITEKTTIGKFAASLIGKDETIFLDSGSTVAEIVPFLDSSINVITNSLDVVNKRNNDLQIYLLGGKVSNVRNSIYGIKSIEQIKDFVFDYAFLGANGISEKRGITTPSIEEATLKKQIILNSNNVYFLIDNSKLGNFSTCKVCDIDSNYVIMNSKNHLSDIYTNIIFPTTNTDN